MDRISRPKLLRDILFHPDPAVIQAQLHKDERWEPLSS